MYRFLFTYFCGVGKRSALRKVLVANSKLVLFSYMLTIHNIQGTMAKGLLLFLVFTCYWHNQLSAYQL